jgi:uncharacterized OB-fold protein
MSLDVFPAGLPTSSGDIDPETSAYWDGADSGQLILPYCTQCAKYFWYPRGFCPRCGGSAVSWRQSPGLGTIYSFATVHNGFGEWAEHAPFVVAYVALPEGITLSTNVVECSAERLDIGLQVQAVFERSHADHLPALRFRPLP